MRRWGWHLNAGGWRRVNVADGVRKRCEAQLRRPDFHHTINVSTKPKIAPVAPNRCSRLYSICYRENAGRQLQ